MAIEVFTYASGDTFAAVMDAVASLTSASDMKAAIRILFAVTVMAALLEVALTGSLKPSGRILVFVFISFVAIFPKVDLQITDRINPAKSTSVSNVPIGLGLPIYLFSNLGNWFTQKTETVFSLPNDMQFHDNGVMFGSRLVKSSSGLNSVDPTFASNMAEFASSCIYFGANIGWFDWQDLMETDDIWGFLSSSKFSNAIFAEYYDKTTTPKRQLTGCKNFRIKLETQWTAVISKTETLFAGQMYPGVSNAEAKTRLLSALPVSYSYLLGVSRTASQIVQQNVMINAMSRGYKRLAVKADATAALQDYAIAQGEIQSRTTYSAVGEGFKQALPLIQVLAEMIAYGLFPLLILMIMISRTPGKTAASYLQLYIFLQIIPPLYALFHFIMMQYAAAQTLAFGSYIDATGSAKAALTLLTYNGIYQTNANLTSMASYATTLIPMVALAIARGAGGQVASALGSIGGVISSSISQSSGKAAAGNVSMGSFDMNNGRMMQNMMSPMSTSGFGTQTGSNGVTTTTDGNGNTYKSFMKNDTGLNANLSSAITSGINTQAGASMQALSTARTTQGMGAMKTFSSISNLMNSQSKGKGSGVNWSTGNAASLKQEYGKTERLSEQFNKTNDLSRSQNASLLAAMSANVGLGFEVLGTGVKTKLQAELKGKTDAQIKDLWSSAQSFNKDTGFSKQYGKTMDAAHKASASGELKDSTAFSQSDANNLSRQIDHRHETAAAMQNAETWQQMKSRNEQLGQSVSLNADGLLFKAYAKKHDSMNMAETTFASARQGGENSIESMNKIMNFIQSDVVGSQGMLSKILQMDSAPTSDKAKQYYTNEEAKVDAKGTADTKDAIALQNRPSVETMAGTAGVPTSEQIQMGFDAIQKQSIDRNNSFSKQVDDGRNEVSTSGGNVKSEVDMMNQGGRKANTLSDDVISRGGKQVVDSLVDYGGDAADLVLKGADKILKGGNEIGKAVTDAGDSYGNHMHDSQQKWNRSDDLEPTKTGSVGKNIEESDEQNWKQSNSDLPPPNNKK